MIALRRLCGALGWPRLSRAQHRDSTRAPSRAPAPDAAPAAAGEFRLAVAWQRAVDDSGGEFPPAESGGGWLYGTSDDPRLAIPLVWTEAKVDRRAHAHYESLRFCVAPALAEDIAGRTLVVNGTPLGTLSWSSVPAGGARYRDVPAAHLDRGLMKQPQVRVPPAWLDAICDELGVWKRERT